jgi:hypothetical protein
MIIIIIIIIISIISIIGEIALFEPYRSLEDSDGFDTSFKSLHLANNNFSTEQGC